MGGFGSGRRPSHRRTIDGVPAFGVGEFLAGERAFLAGWYDVRFEQGHWVFTLADADHAPCDTWPPTFFVEMASATPRLGGLVLYAVCPECRARRKKLYWASARLVCRECAKLAYASQQLNPLDRAVRKVAKQHIALGGSGDIVDLAVAPPVRPRGMHESRYIAKLLRLAADAERLRRRIARANERLAYEVMAAKRRHADLTKLDEP